METNPRPDESGRGGCHLRCHLRGRFFYIELVLSCAPYFELKKLAHFSP